MQDPSNAALAQAIAEALNNSQAVNHLAEQVPVALLVIVFALLLFAGVAWLTLRVQRAFHDYLAARDKSRAEFEARLDERQERREGELRQVLSRLTDALTDLSTEVRLGHSTDRRPRRVT